MIHGATMERLHQLSAAPIAFAEDRGIPQGRLADRTVDLTAGRRLLVEDHGVDAELGGRDGRGHSGGAGTNHGELVALFDQRSAHGSTPRPPRPVSTRMPSRTCTTQACRLPP